MRQREHEVDWVEQVPETRFRGPYRGYGWESQQSALPEFRDPGIHFMPYEREELKHWQGSYPRTIVGPRNVGGRSARGPHAGKGPRGYIRSDERIYDEVCDLLTRHGQIDAREIAVQVKGGEVTLTGTVEDRGAKRLAEDLCDSVNGVRDVHNLLRLQSGHETPDRWRDRVAGSGVYPASTADAPADAQTQGMASWGQGERGAEGYNDHGGSELHLERGDPGKT